MNIPGPDRSVEYRIDAPSAWAEINRPGEYRVSVQPGRGGEVELAVLRGSAELVNEDGRTALGAGERAYASGNAAPSNVYVFNSAAWDEFDRWSEARRDQRLGVSAQYLPADARYYSATLDEYGAWSQEPTYGYVWYPTSRRRLATVLPRPLVTSSSVWLDVDRRRSLGVGHASLRTMGILGRAGGTGSPDERGVRHGCRGRTRLDT